MILGAIILLGAFVVLAVLVQAGGAAVVLDGVVQAGLTPFRNRYLLVGFNWLTQWGTGGTGAAVGLGASAMLFSFSGRHLVAPFWLAFIGAEATTWSVKFLTRRVRPPFLEGLTAGSPSFPSAHSTVSIAVYGFLALVAAQAAPEAWRTTIYVAAAALILLIGFSRLLLSLHYFTDVLGGFLVGGAWLLLAWRMAQSSG